MRATGKVDEILNNLKSRIFSGEFGKEGRLTSLRTLASDFSTTQETINKVLQILQAEGWVISSGQKGLFVNMPRVRMPGLTANFYVHLKDNGLEAKEETIGYPEFIQPDEEMAKSMLLPKDAQVLFRLRKQGSTKIPFRLVYGYYPKAFITEEMMEKIKTDEHFHIVNAIKERFGKAIKNVHEDIIVRLPNSFEQEQLQIVRANPVVDMTVINYTHDRQTVIMYNKMIFNANFFLFTYDYKVHHWD